MTITAKQEGGQLTLFIDGRVDTTTSARLQEEILKALGGSVRVVADFEKVPYISSAGLRSLLIGQKTAAAKHAQFVLTHVNEMVLSILETVGFTEVLTIE